MGFVIGTVQKIVSEGAHGPYAVATVEGIQGSSVTFSLSNSVWQEVDYPEPGTKVILSDLCQKRQGWRAMCGRYVRPSDQHQLAISTEKARTMNTEYPIVKGDLHFAMVKNGEFICQEMAHLPTAFAERWSVEQVRAAIEELLLATRDFCVISAKNEADAQRPKAERNAEALVILDKVLPSIREKIASTNPSVFDELMFWLDGYWYYYNPGLRGHIVIDLNKFYEKILSFAVHFLLPVLPEQVRKVIGNTELISVVAGHGHFAMLFSEKERSKRYIVTDTQLFELHNVNGYNYLDIMPNGKPIARCCTNRGGERAFFDGVRLMSHDRFQTCAPKAVFVDGGYKVNSTKCTIINGNLHPLIEIDDRLSYSTGVWYFGGTPVYNGITTDIAMDSYAKSEHSAEQIRVVDGRAYQNGQELKPIGMFHPSHTILQSSGFALVEWSEFSEVPNYHYQNILVVDDKQEWIDQVRATFASGVSTFNEFQTPDKHAALKRIQEVSPVVLLLDVHLTAEEEFDGLWIANKLYASSFKGLILLTSSYGREKLQAMAELVKGPAKAPGKDLERIRQILLGKG